MVPGDNQFPPIETRHFNPAIDFPPRSPYTIPIRFTCNALTDLPTLNSTR